MIIDNNTDYLKFIEENQSHNLIIDAIGSDINDHPAIAALSLVFVKNIFTGKNYTLSIDHPDGVFNIKKEKLLTDINSFVGKNKGIFEVYCSNIDM